MLRIVLTIAFGCLSCLSYGAQSRGREMPQPPNVSTGATSSDLWLLAAKKEAKANHPLPATTMTACISDELGISPDAVTSLLARARIYYLAEREIRGSGPNDSGLSPSTYSALTDAGLSCFLRAPNQTVSTSAHATRDPIPLRKVEPGYSVQARRANFNGIIKAIVTIGADGTVSGVRFPAGEQLYGLRDNIVTALAHWRFLPALKDGDPVPATVDLTFTFQQY